MNIDRHITFQTPSTLYVGSGDYDEYACSESDPYAPQSAPMYWVRIEGGEVTADVLCTNEDGSAWDEATQGDRWDYNVVTGLTMTADEINEATR